MNGNKILVDTNIAVYFLSGYNEAAKYFFDFHPIFSFITELELLSGTGFTSDEKKDMSLFMSKQVVIDYLPGLKKIIINIRSTKSLKLPDAIIAATAIYMDLPLVSSDTAFRKIGGLKFIYHEPPVA